MRKTKVEERRKQADNTRKATKRYFSKDHSSVVIIKKKKPFKVALQCIKIPPQSEIGRILITVW